MDDLSALPSVLTNRYELLQPLGKGGFATVYLARDLTLNRQVAVKLYALRPDEDPAKQDKEADMLARLNHPNIVKVLDAGREGELSYIVMEFLEGKSLREKMVPGTPMLQKDALGLAAVLADALQAAHDLTIVHLDIKPENILFDRRGRPYLTDFGIGRIMGRDNETRQTRAMGTSNYASPEQRQGLKLTAAADIYSLGVVLFELLTGDLPLGPAPAHPQPPYSPPLSLNHPLASARELVLLLCKALAAAPTVRFESSSQFAQQLRSYLLRADGTTGALTMTGSRTRQFGNRSIARVHIAEPEHALRVAEGRRIPESARDMTRDMQAVPQASRVTQTIYSHQGVEIGVGALVEQSLFARGRVRLRQDAVVRGDVISLLRLDVSQGVQARNLLAPEIAVRGPIRLEGSLFCRRLRPIQDGGKVHLPDGSELGGSLIFGAEFEKIVADDELGRPLNQPREPITFHGERPLMRVGASCTLVAILGDVDIEIDPNQVQLNTVRVQGNVTLGEFNTVRRLEGHDVHIGPGCIVDEVHARGRLVVGKGSRIGYMRAAQGIELADGVQIASPIFFTDNGAIREQGEAAWVLQERVDGTATGSKESEPPLNLTAYHLFDHQHEGQQGSLGTVLLDHRLYQLYDRIAPGWLPRLKPTHFQGSGERISQEAQPPPSNAGEFLAIDMDLTPAEARPPSPPADPNDDPPPPDADAEAAPGDSEADPPAPPEPPAAPRADNRTQRFKEAPRLRDASRNEPPDSEQQTRFMGPDPNEERGE